MNKVTEKLIWKALSDPIRRRQLDLLRNTPLTTSELCDHFPGITRYGVMKHLTSLEKAGLIFIRRNGKFRWNHLNPAPIQAIYERWIKPFEANWAEKALSLKHFIETEGAIMKEMNSVQIELEVSIQAPRARVWGAIINEVGSWWHPDFYAIPGATITLEPRAGGRLYEKNPDGAEGLWYTVTAINPERILELVGHLRPEYGGPATSLLKLSLGEKDGVTKLAITDTLFGSIDENTRKNIGTGWQQLFEEGLKAYLENQA